VFIPILLMGGIVGRLFREFAVTLSIAIAVSAIISLTLTPMMCARFLKPESKKRHGPLSRTLERGFDLMLRAYERTLDFILRHQRITLFATLLLIGITVTLYIEIPKGLFPQQDAGFITGFSEAPQDISFQAMYERQQQLDAI